VRISQGNAGGPPLLTGLGAAEVVVLRSRTDRCRTTRGAGKSGRREGAAKLDADALSIISASGSRIVASVTEKRGIRRLSPGSPAPPSPVSRTAREGSATAVPAAATAPAGTRAPSPNIAPAGPDPATPAVSAPTPVRDTVVVKASSAASGGLAVTRGQTYAVNRGPTTTAQGTATSRP
jgi:hypothetical protein